MALAARERCHRLADRAHRRHPQIGKRLGRGPFHVVLVEEPVAQSLPAEEHVLDDVEVVRQREVLVDRLDAEPGGIARAVDLDRPAFPQELAVVDLVDPGDALRQDRLAGPVVPHQRGSLSGRQVEVDVIEGLDRTEVLLDAPQREEGPRSGGRVFGHLRHAFTLAREERGRRRAGGGAIVI